MFVLSMPCCRGNASDVFAMSRKGYSEADDRYPGMLLAKEDRVFDSASENEALMALSEVQ